jgi:hypothetical protein
MLYSYLHVNRLDPFICIKAELEPTEPQIWHHAITYDYRKNIHAKTELHVEKQFFRQILGI